MKKWKWVTRAIAEAVHERQIAEHGGGSGVRDEKILQVALARLHRLARNQKTDAASLTASLVYELAKNHPFVDGNKRTAWTGARLFLRMNRSVLKFEKTDAARMMLRLAGGELTEVEVASWFRDRITR